MCKNFIYLVMGCLGLFSLSLQAQDQNNPFKITVGTNAIDAFPTNAVNPFETGKLFEEFFNVKDHWNFMTAANFVSGSMYLDNGFSVGLRGSLNKITTLGNTPANKMYYALDANVQYAFLENTKIDPFVSAGLGHYWMEENSSATANVGLGLNYWFNDFIGLSYESVYKHTKNISGVAHIQHSFGVSIKGGGSDRDKDGVYDKQDECPDVAGLAQFNGCPDSDGDGIIDSKDQCPNTPGLPEFNGCADSDGDGVIDPKDQCPNTPGILAFNGCPDTDGDGIKDAQDQCPEVAGVPENNGCPAVQKQLDDYSKTILFVLEKAEILEESYPALNHILEIVQEYPEATFTVSGHADSRGTKAFNQKLSEERAQSIVDYMVNKGIATNRFQVVGYGETKPIATNINRAGRKLNRRVEVVVD